MLLPCVVQMLQSDLDECNRPADEAAQVNAIAPEGNAPKSAASTNTGPSTSDGADENQAKAASHHQQQQEAGAPQQSDAQSPNQQADSMLDAPAVLEENASQQDNDTATNAALAPAEAADKEEAEVPGIENAAAGLSTGVPAPKHHTPTANQSFRKPGRQRKSRKPTAGAPDVALQLDEAKSAGRAVTRCQLAKTGETLQSSMQDSAVLASAGLKPSKADSASDCQRQQLRRSRKGGKPDETDQAGALAKVQAEVGHISSRTTLDLVAAGTKPSTLGQNKLGCSKCRYVKTGCKACRERLLCCKEASGRGGRKRAPSANAAPRKAAEVQHSPHRVLDTGKQLHSQQPSAKGPEPNSRAARAANRALKRPIRRSGSGEESDAEQLAIKPMPTRLQHRKLLSSSQHEAHAPKQPTVQATPHGAVVVDLPAARPSSSAIAQTATLDSGASAQPTGLSLGTGEMPYSLRRSARHQQSAQPAVSGIAAEDVNKAATTGAATAAAVAAPTTAATPAAAEQVAPETVRRSGRARKPALLQYESAPSKGVKRGAAEHAVISDSEDDMPSASTATAAAPAGKSTARKKKVCRQQAGLPVLSPIQEADEERDQHCGPDLDPASEFVNHLVHTHSDIAQHLAGLSPLGKRKRPRKAPAPVKAGSPAKSRLAVSAEQSQLQTELSNPMDVLLAAAEYTEAHAQQDPELKSACSKVSLRFTQRSKPIETLDDCY